MANDIKGKVKSLYEIMKEEKIQELEVNSKEYSICIKRKDNNEVKVVVPKKQTVIQSPVVSEEEKAEVVAPSGDTIKSPITGVFYKFPSPSSPVFVNEGDIVEVGKTICIIEAMKVLNEIKATFKVKIVKILAENGKPVNSGQDLFEIEKV
jgi:acetyl-CoA carboxylase biotin carboxyl carrier protein